MEWWRPDLFAPLAAALVAGCTIGFEREYRARSAGFRTHGLVALASALLMLAAQHQVEWSGPTTPVDVMRIDPVRMAHGILTGVGFLCGGVIFREGLSVHGLTTAASLWTTSALGILFGVGFHGLGVLGTICTLTVLVGLRLIGGYLPGHSLTHLTVRFVGAAAPSESELGVRLREIGLKADPRAQRMAQGGAVVEYDLVVEASGRLDVDRLARLLSADPNVIEYLIERRNA